VTPMPERRQTLTDASITVEDGQTIMAFTKALNEPGEIEISTGENKLLGAYGSGVGLGLHAKRQSVVLNLSSGASEEASTPNKAVWLAHGIGAFLAWGILVPSAVKSSLLRSVFPNQQLWFKLHRAFNALAYALFVIIFAIAVATVGREGGGHFRTGHAKMGLAMLILTTFQVLGGVLRPHLPSSGEEKTVKRRGWEAAHRIVGTVLLACAFFYQMIEGIELYAAKYSVGEGGERQVAIVYWLWTAVVVVDLVACGWYFRYYKARAKKEGGEEAAADGFKKPPLAAWVGHPPFDPSHDKEPVVDV